MELLQIPRIKIYCWFSLWARLALAQFQSFTPAGQNGIMYSVNIPDHTAASGSGPIYFQLKSASELQWIALGQGSQMQGANLFVVYASGSNNNITVSPRMGPEHVQPLYNPSAQVSLLSGSGVSNGGMTANIRCDSCITWAGGHEDVTSSSSPWIWAIKSGPPLDSDSPSATITQHDFYGIVSLNLKQATGGSSDNPFSGATPSSPAQVVSTSSGGSISRKRTAHAIIMITVFVVFFPSFALTLHVIPYSKTVPYIHAPLQLFTLALAIAGFGLGISMARSLHYTGKYHPIVGYVTISCLILFQPAMGLLQHLYFRRTGRKSVFAYLHRWLGRTLITLGIINAGLGFHLTGIGLSIAPVGAVIAFSVVAGLVGLAYTFIVILLPRRRSTQST